MKLSKKTLTCAVVASCLLTIGVYWTLKRVPDAGAESRTLSYQATEENPVSDGVSQKTEIIPSSTPAQCVEEVAATRRMYASHAPLRAPELVDPDSNTNREILQTMVQKAMARKTGEIAVP